MNYAIEVENLTKIYDGLKAVDNISFKVREGEIFAFLGPNGAGKTTTVEMIEGIRVPTSGKIRVLGKEMNGADRDIKERIGVLPQEFSSFERLTVRETLFYFSSIYRKDVDIDHIIEIMNLHDEEKVLYRNLSGGLKQRVNIAIALVNDPEIVFLDEPTTGLDPRSRRDVWKAIEELKNRGKTVFLTTHYMEEAEYLADTVTIIHKGKIVAQGSPEKLVEKYGGKSTLIIKGGSSTEIEGVMKEMGYGKVRIKNSSVEIRMEKRDEVMDILFRLREKNVRYREVDIKHSDLEDVFLQLTGEKLEGEAK
ncbi:MAG: ABC transporter ATP-binding protein [Thermoplasmata archaeon]|nr:ABC transporter ATP-binding protein [Thermoplasmata archaeon]